MGVLNASSAHSRSSFCGFAVFEIWRNCRPPSPSFVIVTTINGFSAAWTIAPQLKRGETFILNSRSQRDSIGRTYSHCAVHPVRSKTGAGDFRLEPGAIQLLCRPASCV